MLKTSKLLTVSVIIYLLSFILTLFYVIIFSSLDTELLIIFFSIINPIAFLLVILSISLIYYKKIDKVIYIFFKILLIGIIITILNIILGWLFISIIIIMSNESSGEAGLAFAFLIIPTFNSIILTIITSIIFGVVKKIRNKRLSSNIAQQRIADSQTK